MILNNIEKIQLTPEELTKLQDLNTKTSDLVTVIGQTEMQISLLQKHKEYLLASFLQIQQDQNQLAEELTQKYGDGEINTATGEFTKAK